MSNKKTASLLSPVLVLFYIIILFCITVTAVNPAFLTPATFITIARAGLFTMCFALCEMTVLISGGIDVSFPAIGCFAMCIPMYLYDKGIIGDSPVLFLFIAAVCGLIPGLLNGLLIADLKITPLIATLATSSIVSGGLILLIGVQDYSVLPPALNSISNINLFTYIDQSTGFSYSLTVFFLVPVILCLIVSFILRFTMLGRGLYAMGGDQNAARTCGFNIRKLTYFTYALSGIVTGITATIYTTLMHVANPTALMGEEMLVIAACVIGGCNLKGGYGNVSGVMLGVLLITMVQNSLNILGIASSWQTFAVGLVLVCGILITAIRQKLEAKRMGR